jgi:transposase
MENVRFVGLDVHADSIAIALAEPGRGEPCLLGVVQNDTSKLVKRLRRLGPVKCCYEAGPTGFGLHRDLAAAGIDCVVVAPSLIPARAGERIKTDRRDALKLARFLRSGDLTPIHVPDQDTEAIRDLERGRACAVRAEIAARNQLSKFLLRHGRRFQGKTKWTKDHLRWLHAQKFDHPAQQRVLFDYLKTVEDLRERVAGLTATLAEMVESWRLAPVAKALQALRGIDVVSSAVLVAEVGDFRRFERARDFMGYVGIVPREHSSGEMRRQGAITRAGNGHVRRTLVEAAWHYRHPPRVSRPLRDRSRGASDDVRRIAWKAQERLSYRYRKLNGRGLNKNKVIVAVARELAAFVWAIARTQQAAA